MTERASGRPQGWPLGALPGRGEVAGREGAAPTPEEYLELAWQSVEAVRSGASPEALHLFEQSRGGFDLRKLEGLIDGQVHLIWQHPDWGNPILAPGPVLHMLSALGGDVEAGNEAVVALAWKSPNVLPMLHFELRDVEEAVRQLEAQVAQLPPGRAFGVGEIEWARPYADVAAYRRFFEAVALVASGRPVVVDLHTGGIEASAVDAVRGDYADWLSGFDDPRLHRTLASSRGWDSEANSGAAHDPRPLWPLLEELSRSHPNLRFVLSHPFNPVGGEENPSVQMALALPNVLLGTAARREEQLQLIAAANEDLALRQRGERKGGESLWDRIVFQSDGGGAAAALDWVEMVMGATGDEERVQKVLFRTLAKAMGVLDR